MSIDASCFGKAHVPYSKHTSIAKSKKHLSNFHHILNVLEMDSFFEMFDCHRLQEPTM